MKKESNLHAKCGEPIHRITRAKAAAISGKSNATNPKAPSRTKLLPTKSENKIIRQKNLRILPDNENGTVSSAFSLPSKRKMALRDVTNVALKNTSNVYRGSSYKNRIHRAEVPVQLRKLQRAEPGPPIGNVGSPKAKVGATRKYCTLAVEVETEELVDKDELNQDLQIAGNDTLPAKVSVKQGSEISEQNVENIQDSPRKVKAEVCDPHESTIRCKHVDIDLDHCNPQMCSTYVVEIYANLRIHELDTRPVPDFMETVQRDITQSMRAILIDWLVEVAQEYKLVPDTLYLTVHILDQFLSHNYIERQRLQLLGITCMLIASKYEEICAPRVEEFCFITDNTYTSQDVRKMEKQVLNHLGFRLSVPTAKTFLRRFLRAAQASYKVPPLVLEFLANYLVELTMIEYAFLKFTPSVIAASAVFLAKWTLDQSSHPWNSILEHYTCYKASDLKASVFAMHCLQRNSKCCPLRAVRDKYGQLKFKYVANLPSQELRPSLFVEVTPEAAYCLLTEGSLNLSPKFKVNSSQTNGC